ncbi:LysR family transcriptional regulator [Candidatus Methylacidithermus pantelleriae]|uniref:LysR family transcriptional regulator n=1 Tax=Candidatus Methylacidithermus pantelleriae TaxID=2744239 RepID=A0A8J2FTD4_9BACT|nr:LysR family transcriptional regulator [Candidatus Methylacidithermus pantelleriae]CAF0701919.1 LysR family transcriptional regulator [Candidatus Methylacidithermus pantelleriae]
MQIETFKVFQDLVDSRSFSKAAQLNFISQSAVSQQIRALEERFHVPLIDRGNKYLSLTREGQIFYESAKEIVNLYQSLQNRLAELRNVVSGVIRVSTVYSIGLHELPPYLRRFLKEYPEVNVRIEYRHARQVYEDVQDGLSDVGLVAYPVQRKTIRVEPFRKDRLVVICYPSHPFAQRKEVTLAEVAKEKFVGFESDIPTRKAIDRIFRERGLELRPVMEFDNIETVKRAVEIEAGISVVPLATVQQELKTGTLCKVEFAGQSYYRPLGILCKAGRVLSPAIKRFLETLKQEPVEGALGD